MNSLESHVAIDFIVELVNFAIISGMSRKSSSKTIIVERIISLYSFHLQSLLFILIQKHLLTTND